MTSDVETLDTGVLSRYLEAHLEGFRGPLSVHKFTSGQSNPTFRIDAASGTYVLRRQPPGKLLKSAHAVDREYRVMRALRGTPVPVPKALLLCEDREVIGSMFFVMGFCDGRVYFPAHLPDIADNAERAAMYDALNEVLAAIHSLDPEACGLGDYGKPGAYFERQLSRWSRQYRAAEMRPIEPIETLIAWLEAQQPQDDDASSLVHGDYRLDNVIFHPTRPQIIAVIDWELSTIGHPIADLAYQCMQWRLPNELGTHQGLGGIDRASLGIPTEREYIERYCARRRIAGIDNWTFHLALSFFRLAAIVQGVVKRASQGNASSRDAASMDALIEPLALLALKTIDEDPGRAMKTTT
jgi:aminoglycoside phosphotransferase (APT) family kinase protein